MTDVLAFEDIDQTQVALVGGKGAHLAELARIGLRVPPGFCITTAAYHRVVGDLVDRAAIEALTIPDDLAAKITARIDPRVAYAVRSSATAEDSPTASFAGLQDTYLNIVGPEAILAHVRRCWASLFTERAVAYRQRFAHQRIAMAVVVQQMVLPDAAGVLFTADPLTGHRKTASIEAVFGLGEALVGGLVNADAYQVRDGAIIAKTIARKRLAIYGYPEGGTYERTLAPARQTQPALSDAQVLALAALGRRIEAHFGRPQDIEWCLVGDDVHVVQSRPITTLFPIPVIDDGAPHVYISVGHQQMMTDPMRPLGLSLFQRITAGTMHEAGGRLFVDVARRLASPTSRAALMAMVGRNDPLIGDALRTVHERGFVAPLPDEGAPPPRTAEPVATDAAIVRALIARSEASLAALARDIQAKSGAALIDFIVDDLQELRRVLFAPDSLSVIMAAVEATWWLNDRLHAWLGEKNAADTLTLSAPDNVTSEMGLALLDVADAIRPYPEVIARLEHAGDDFLDDLVALPGGREARAAIAAYLARYGMRGVGEIDITRPRWREQPSALVPMILANLANFAPGAAAQRFAHGAQEAARKAEDVLARLRALPDGAQKAEETAQMIERVRTFIGYREYPKYGMVSRCFVYKQALLAEADRLVAAGVLHARDDLYFLRFDELHEAIRDQRVDHALLAERRDAFRAYAALTPPRVLTSDGEVITGAYRREDLPPGALAGLPVSAGTIEGRARVILDLADARLAPGDILVTAFTDPSWTPLFVAAAGLVTEVGGLMTHGAVIAREYGLPAVVGVERATQRIRDGQRIRVHGTEGYVEVL